MVVLMVAAVMVAIAATAGPAMAQDPKAERKAERKAAKQAAKQAKRAQNPGAKNPGAQNPEAQKQLPATGGISAGSVALLGTGALLVGGGLVVRRAVRH
ncbi:MAG: LPXTG cell wall anchor domain-containing protein [Actinomycetota bacterium]|jgi:LPXTG-motif cell wall-anchored protein|nr:LPXTG cell wall anchor domain-containing protein [Actinomycetota bacterium]